AAAVREDPTGHAEKPGERGIGDVGEPAPRDGERLGHDLLRGVRVAPAKRVGENRVGVRVEQRLETTGLGALTIASASPQTAFPPRGLPLPDRVRHAGKDFMSPLLLYIG